MRELTLMDQVFVTAAVVFMLNRNMGNTEPGGKKGAYLFIDGVGFTHFHIFPQVNMAFKMNLTVCKVPGMHVMNIVDFR